MAQFIAVIDIGKTNAKVAIVDSSIWSEVAVRTTPNNVLRTGPYPHFDIDGLWQFILSSIKQLNNAFPIAAISISTHGACGVLLDDNGELALPVLDYEYEGPNDLATLYDAARPPFSQTGSPRLSMGLNLGAQLFWQMHTFPDLAKQVAHILTYAQYWAYKLTGNMATEVTSLGCHTDLWNPWESRFSSLVSEQGWLKLMAPVHKAEDKLGTVTASVAALTGLSPSTPVTCGIHDSNASLYPYLNAREAPFSVVSSGTWVIAMAIGGAPIAPDPTRDTLVNVNAYGDPVPSSRFMGGREYNVLTQGQDNDFSKTDITSVLQNELYLLPAIENRSGPFKGSIHQWIGDEPDGGERFIAVSFYLAMMTSTCLELIGARGPTIVEGPFSGNKPYLGMLSAATGRTVVASQKSGTGTSIGAAMLANLSNINVSNQQTDTDKVIDSSPRNELTSYAKNWTRLAMSQFTHLTS